MRRRIDLVETIKQGVYYVSGILMASAFLTVLVFTLLLLGASYRPAPAQPIIYKLTWTAAVPRPGLPPLIGNVPETARFKSETECSAFGIAMSSRLQDWVRGRFNTDWNHPVGVRFTCEVDGQPS